MNDDAYLQRGESAAPRTDDHELTTAELIAQLLREERMRADLPRSSGISIVILCDVNIA